MAADEAPRGLDMGRLPQRLGYVLRRAQVAVFQDLYRGLAETAITPTEYSVLTLLAHNAGLRAGQIAEGLGVKHANFVRVQEKLEERGLLRRARAADDGRAMTLTLSAEGRKLLKKLDRIIEQHDARVAARLSEDERATLLRLLTALAGA
jgi:DNA-binding MarR family transcriptional regulator